ncbi:MAG: nucleotidyltransferase substrate binding protein [Deltaproteobacteria bacterium]|nr:nucleotidyltransferase substrate binding protein [Deltaproteobacteria bacterium]
MDNEKKDIRWKQRFQNFEKAFLLLERTLGIKNPSEAEKGGLIQFYEMSFELAWKLMKDYLDELGFTVNSPREAIKQAFQSGIIENGQEWIDALEDRNLTTHTYDEGTAEKVVSTIRTSYFPMLRQVYLGLSKEVKR